MLGEKKVEKIKIVRKIKCWDNKKVGIITIVEKIKRVGED